MTLTEPQTTAKYFTTGEVLEATGLSFRVLDYWLRTGAIRIADRTPGSGVSRRYTFEELGAIQRLADRYGRATSEIEAIRSGEAWANLTGA